MMLDYSRVKIYLLHGKLNTAVDVRDVQRSDLAALRELVPVLLGDGPDVALPVLLPHLQLLRQQLQPAPGTTHVKNSLGALLPTRKYLSTA